ncbi:MAG: response regulator [Polyangiales bacterium]
MGASVQSDGEIEHAVAGLERGRGRAVLIVEPSPDHQARLARLTAVSGHRAVATSTLDGARALLRAFPVDLVLLAEELTGDTPLPVVAEMVGRRPNARVVIMTHPKSDDEPSEFPQLGTLEYIPRSLGHDDLQSLLG